MKFISGYTDKENGLITDIPLIAFGDHSLTLKYLDFPFFYGGDGLQFIRPKKDMYNLKFFFYLINILKSKISTNRYSRHYSILKQLEIPLPPMAVQEKIVTEMEQQESIIKLSKLEIDKINTETNNIDMSGYTTKKLNDICLSIIAGGDAPKDLSKTKTEIYNIPIYSNGTEEKSLYGYTTKAKVYKESITISARGTIGYTSIRTQPFVPIVRLISVTPNTDYINIKYMKYILDKSVFNHTGGIIPQLTIPNIKETLITLPSLLEQEKIVFQIENNQELIKEYKNSILQAKQKQKDIINEILLIE